MDITPSSNGRIIPASIELLCYTVHLFVWISYRLCNREKRRRRLAAYWYLTLMGTVMQKRMSRRDCLLRKSSWFVFGVIHLSYRECSARSRRERENCISRHCKRRGRTTVLGEDRELAEIASVFAYAGRCQYDSGDWSWLTRLQSVERNLSIMRPPAAPPSAFRTSSSRLVWTPRSTKVALIDARSPASRLFALFVIKLPVLATVLTRNWQSDNARTFANLIPAFGVTVGPWP